MNKARFITIRHTNTVKVQKQLLMSVHTTGLQYSMCEPSDHKLLSTKLLQYLPQFWRSSGVYTLPVCRGERYSTCIDDKYLKEACKFM